jgi:hypothetical protein
MRPWMEDTLEVCIENGVFCDCLQKQKGLPIGKQCYYASYCGFEIVMHVASLLSTDEVRGKKKKKKTFFLGLNIKASTISWKRQSVAVHF